MGGLAEHDNPIILDAAGRIPTGFFLLPASYKFVFSPPADTDPPTAAIWSRDNIGATPGTTVEQDIPITAGEALSANDAAYISDGSGGLTAGRAYKGDADNAYSSTTPETGLVVADVAIGSSGTLRQGGRMTGFIGLTAGARYYISATAGGITTSVLPNSRSVGQADSVTSLLINTAGAGISDAGHAVCHGRLSLTTAVPVTTADVTAATAVKWVPYRGNEVAIYSGSAWVAFRLSELSINVPATTATAYDLFLDYNSGTPALALLAWTNLTTRATALALQDGVLVLTGSTGKRYVGSFCTTGVSGQTEDSAAKRYLWNYYNRVPRLLQKTDTTASWTYTTATWRQARADATNQLDIMVGVSEVLLSAHLKCQAQNDTSATNINIGIGEDSTTTPVSAAAVANIFVPGAALVNTSHAVLLKYPAIGRHFYPWLEASTAVGTTTFFGASATTAGSSTATGSGLFGSIDG